jgi:hypothetical protein
MRQTLRRACGLSFALILSASVIFPDAPDGYPVFDGLKDQFTIALPAGWSAYDQTQALGGKAGLRGTIVFSAERLTKEGETLADPAVMARADTGDLPSFFVDRKSAAKGMTCAKFTKSAAYNLGVLLTEDPIFGALRRRFSATPIHHDPISVGGCRGYHYKGEGKNGSWILDVRAVSDGKTLYLFSLRNTAENFGKNLGTFEKAMETLRLAAQE